jgi:CubicO group peptidase (beta-lactamase class C family)
MTPAEFAKHFPRATAVFEQGRQRGLHHGAQVYVSRHGEVLADVGLGDSTPGESLTADHITHWLSAGKPLAAVLIAQLWEQGRIDWDTPLVDVIPEFGNQGKERITLRHTLTHTAGLRNVDTGWPDVPWNETLARICAAPLDDGAVPGETAGYHVASTWFLLGEIIQRLTGRAYADVLREQIFAPAMMTETVAYLPLENVSRSLPDERDTGLIAPLYERVAGQLQMLDWHQPPRSTAPSPGSSHRGPIRDLGHFYEALLRSFAPPAKGGTGGVASGAAALFARTPPNPPLAGGAKEAVLRAETVAAITSRQRVGQYDLTLGHIVDFGLGVIVDSNRYGVDTVPYGYGRYCSPRTFGHGGSQSSQGYCDPDHGLVVAYLFNGRPGEGQHQRRARAFNEALCRDVGIGEEVEVP